MKKKKMCLFLAAAAALNIACFQGCGSKNEISAEVQEKPAIAYMIARTANSRPMDFSMPLIQESMEKCAENFGYTFVVRVDGEPEVVAAEDLDMEEQFKTASRERLKRDARIRSDEMMEVLGSVTAVYPEVDFLEGLRCSAQSLRSLDESYTSRSIVWYGTGVGTTGYMDFTNNLLSAEPQMVVEMLKEKDALPDLTGITVYAVGMAQVEAPQKKLPPRQVKNLENIWKSVVEASGGELVINEYIAVSGKINNEGNLPSVSVVNIPEETPVVFDLEDDEKMEEPVVLGESQVEFVGDSSEYLYPEVAEESIRPIAEYLLKNDSVPLLLVGACAGDITNDKTLKLSHDRAAAVRKTLVQNGVDESRICILGMGSDDPWHVSDAGYDGPVASSNRKVVLLDARTELAAELMNRE